jgi:hypothetical protein
MKTFQTEAEVAAGGVLVLQELPFAAGERVAVTIASPSLFSEMRGYAEKMAEASGELVEETQAHVAERLLRETEW